MPQMPWQCSFPSHNKVEVELTSSFGDPHEICWRQDWVFLTDTCPIPVTVILQCPLGHWRNTSKTQIQGYNRGSRTLSQGPGHCWWGTIYLAACLDLYLSVCPYTWTQQSHDSISVWKVSTAMCMANWISSCFSPDPDTVLIPIWPSSLEAVIMSFWQLITQIKQDTIQYFVV